jgi:hypothetical protein
MPTTTRSQRRRQPVRSQQRRPTTRVVEPPDYSRDYAFVKRDLLLIALIGGLLFAGMIGAYFIL